MKPKEYQKFVYGRVYKNLMSICLSRFKWEGLELEDSMFIERELFENGFLIMTPRKSTQWILSKGVASGTLNWQGFPTRYQRIGFGLDNEEFNTDEIVVIRNNLTETPSISLCRDYAYRLSQILITQDINLQQQKTPVIIKATDKNVFSLKRLFQQVTAGEPNIFTRKSFDENDITTLDIKAEFIYDKLQKAYTNCLNEFLTLMGINNCNTDKRERLITNEVDANNETIQTYLNMYLYPRQKACELMSEKLGREIKCIPAGGDVNGSIHDRIKDVD